MPRRRGGGAAAWACLLQLALVIISAAGRARAAHDAAQDAAVAAHDAATAAEARVRAFVSDTVEYWLRPWRHRRLSAKEFAARLEQLRDPERAGREKLLGLLLHAGEAWVTTGPLPPVLHNTPFLRMLLDVQYVAASHPDLSVEFLLHLGDSPATHGASEVPVFGFDRWGGSLDVPMPHYYVQPDAFCRTAAAGGDDDAAAGAVSYRAAAAAAAAAVPWAEREPRLLGRFTHFCHAGSPRMEPYPHCQRTFFSQLAQRVGAVGNVTLDVAPTNLGGTHPGASEEEQRLYGVGTLVAKEAVPLETQPRAQWAAAGSLANALAMGSVVMHPVDFSEQYFEPALVAGEHYVRLWATAEDDLLVELQRLQAEPRRAARVAAEGRRFACELLGRRPRRRYWAEALARYAATVQAYRVDAALLAARREAAPNGTWRLTAQHVTCATLLDGNACRLHAGAGDGG